VTNESRRDDDPAAAVAVTPAPRIVITGGPGAGKTAVLELARRELCAHVEILPESASIVFGGGFPRLASSHARRCAQRAIYHVQDELENMMAFPTTEGSPASLLCDRGTLDALAYWPDSSPMTFLAAMNTTIERELSRYSAIIHLRVPELAEEYRQSVIRKEPYVEARAIDDRLLDIWARHPRRTIINGKHDFMVKAADALRVIKSEISSHQCTTVADRGR